MKPASEKRTRAWTETRFSNFQLANSGKPCPPLVLRRKNAPKRQGRLGEAERRTNVVGTVGVLRPSAVAGRTVLVVDDVMTTGSTLSECAAELKRAGAARVWCLSLARSLHT